MARIYTRQEAKRRKMKYQIFAGMFDFIGILAGIVVIIACCVLLSSLVKWAINDAMSSFETLWNIFMSAIIIPD